MNTVSILTLVGVFGCGAGNVTLQGVADEALFADADINAAKGGVKGPPKPTPTPTPSPTATPTGTPTPAPTATPTPTPSGSLKLIRQHDSLVMGDKLGWAVSGTGDIDGDGFPDYLIGAPNADPAGLSGAGSVYVISGKTGATIFERHGTVVGEGIGYYLGDAGDVNGDGRDDFLITNRSYAFVHSGTNGSLLFQKVAGGPVAGAGDVNGDGKGDFLVSNLNETFVYSGLNGSLIYQKVGGTSVAAVGDVNGDGRSDFIIGEQYADANATNNGSASVYSGATGALIFRKDGAAIDFELFGGSVAGVGDVNGDGKPDFMVGARLADAGALNSGAAYVYSGANGVLLFQKNGVPDTQLGYQVAGAGDINGDGRAEFMASSLQNANGAGTVYVWSGATGSLLAEINGGAASDNFGASLSGIGDVTGDGKSEFISGAPLADPALHYDAGSGYIFGM